MVLDLRRPTIATLRLGGRCTVSKRQLPPSDRTRRADADAGRLAPAAAVIDRRQRKEPPDLSAVCARPSDVPQTVPIEFRTQIDRRGHRKPLPACDFESCRTGFGNPQRELASRGFGISGIPFAAAHHRQSGSKIPRNPKTLPATVRSLPAQKTVPAPVTTITWTASSLLASVKASTSSAHISTVKAFMRSGDVAGSSGFPRQFPRRCC